jgi:hypothetical protein
MQFFTLVINIKLCFCTQFKFSWKLSLKNNSVQVSTLRLNIHLLKFQALILKLILPQNSLNKYTDKIT